ncbi:VanW family protein [Christensenella tenuis]|uniref:VanW family protein n=1 Tax=Christensenella tenuis TaxID=2763033 RepID=A0ABR7EEK4_9FIRM|nr:VanW family protein [Christensenella tenuis]MBC5648202.1 VanW family protein [Christensenella tenuis]
MRYKRPARGRRVVNKKKVAIFGAVVAAAVVAIVFCAYMFSDVKLTAEDEQELFSTGTFVEGVSVEGIQLGGLTYAEGEAKVKPVAESLQNDNKIEFTVQGEQYSYPLADVGVSVEYEDQLKAAMLYGREGKRWDLMFGEPEAKDFPLDYQFDETKLDSRIDTDSASWGEEAVDASYAVDKASDEDDMTTGGTIVKQDPKDGWTVNVDEIKATVKSQIEAKSFEPFDAQVEILKGSTEAPTGELVLMGSATTTISSSSSTGRKYNIWKMSDILNGAVFKPGEVFSINDTAGDRTVENGWALAPGIENGTYTDQAGGGICQVSSTMYNAALKAEMTIKARVPHTIMAKYVPAGMDATISTGGPDFKVENPYDSDMVMIIKCNIPDSKITVEIWGPVDRDYYLKFESVLEGEEALPDVQYKTNSSLDKYAVERTKVGQSGEQYTIYAQKYDKETDEPVGEKYKVTTSTYSAIAPVVELGSGIPVPAAGTSIEDVKAQAAELKAAEEAANNPPQPSEDPNAQPSPSAEPTPAPEESTDPVTDPETAPEGE